MRQVWVRTGRERYPIKVLRGISIPLTLRNKAVMDAVKSVARQTFDKNFRQQIKFLRNRTG